MNEPRFTIRAQGGFSLVEMLVAMTLGLVLLAGTLFVFRGIDQSSKLNNAMTDMQESARFLLATISSDVRMAGHQGCLDIDQNTATVRALDAPTVDPGASVISGSVVVSDSVWSPAPPLGFVAADQRPAVTGTHTLALQYGGPSSARLNTQMRDGGGAVSAAGKLSIDRDLGLRAGDLAIVSSCDSADMFKVSDAVVTNVGTPSSVLSHAVTHNTGAELTRAYGDATTIGQTTVMRFHSLVYYVANTDLSNNAGDPVRALYRQTYPYGDAANPPVELVQGVENLRVTFGVREADGNLRYVLATDAAYDPARVESLKLGLLMVSQNRVSDTDDVRTYLLAGQSIEAVKDATDGVAHDADRRMRIALDTTVRLRNRGNGS